jgi:hypothetical protein
MKALKVLVAVAVAVMMVAPSAFALHEDDIAEVLSAIGIDFAGYVRSRVSLDIETTEGGAADGGDLEETIFGGTAKGQIDFSATSDLGAMTASAKVSLVMSAGGASSDDAWVALSNDSVEFKLGRFEAPDLHGFGQDFYVPEAPESPEGYTANKARGRKETGMAVMMNPSDAMEVTLGAVYGGDNFIGVRPVVKFSAGAATLTAGGEYYLEMATDNDDESQASIVGFGGKAEFSMGAIGVGAAAAYGIRGGQDADGDDLDEDTNLTVSGWATIGVGETGTLGVGGRYVMEDLDAVDDDNTSTRVYLSYKIQPFMNDNMRWEVGGGYGVADLADDTSNDAIGFATRLRYDF